tara:strand:+ start:1685 stop:2113 length:429 start_codon:yes stop_codon:yes gene_type:complete
MYYLDIAGKGPRKTCKMVIDWFINKYLPRHNLDISIQYRGLKREKVFGYCSVQDFDSRPRDFLIELHTKMDEDLYFYTLFHELWHMYQHVKGQLRDKRGVRLWKGIEHSNTDYEDQPWEKEARTMEEVLYNDFLREMAILSC